MNMITRLSMLVVLCGFAFATTGMGASLDELQQRFKQRYPQLQALKSAGKVGETAAGMVEAVKPEFAGEVAGVASPENADRTELYAQMAKQAGTTPDVVASRNAARNFEKARPGEWLKQADGTWRQK